VIGYERPRAADVLFARLSGAIAELKVLDHPVTKLSHGDLLGQLGARTPRWTRIAATEDDRSLVTLRAGAFRPQFTTTRSARYEAATLPAKPASFNNYAGSPRGDGRRPRSLLSMTDEDEPATETHGVDIAGAREHWL
jgi:hypothetical protein